MISAVLAATGAHWTALQSLAWTTMLADNLGRYSLTEAVHRTFDGKHPCGLCKAIAAEKKSGQKKEIPVPVQKLEFPPLNENLVLIAPVDLQLMPQANVLADSLTHKPPTPPPRGPFA
jgi:hypothetical protein